VQQTNLFLFSHPELGQRNRLLQVKLEQSEESRHATKSKLATDHEAYAGGLTAPRVNNLKRFSVVLTGIPFNDVWEACPARATLLFPGVILAFAISLSNPLVNRSLQCVAWGWPERRQLLVRRRL
jgi:hypothetical protein